jgi:GT2 family glycosyltransferase/peptidoglycan/xylan/chitin deacetylase (PgdA/CDA1 family)
MPHELVCTLHGIGEPHHAVRRDEAFVWVTRDTLTTLLDSILMAQATNALPAVITFDDGNISDTTIALPELVRRGLKATFFICAGRIGAPEYLDRVALHDLLQAGMEVGTHGMHHSDWRTLDDHALDVELGEARRLIEDTCGRSVTVAAIPFGSYDRRVLTKVRRENFECVYTSDGGLARSEARLKPRETLDVTWHQADIRRALETTPSVKARLRRNAAMLYKALRRPPIGSLNQWRPQLNHQKQAIGDRAGFEHSMETLAATSRKGEPPAISIIVVNYRTRELTLECVRSVMRQTKSSSYEILLVDNNSNDGLVAAVAREMPDVRCFPLQENIGFARANNIATEQAEGKYLLLLNPDTLVLDGAIDHLLAFAAERPKARIWGGRTLFADRSLNPASCWHRMTLWSVFCRTVGLAAAFPNSRFFNTEAYGGWDRSTVREVDIVSGCFLLIEREMWQKLGGFDPRFFMYGEEADLCLRATAFGAKPSVTPKATIVHYGGESPQVEAERMVLLLTAKAELIKRHLPPMSRRIGLILFALWPLFRVVRAHLVFAISGNGTEVLSCREVWRRRRHWRGGLRANTMIAR